MEKDMQNQKCVLLKHFWEWWSETEKLFTENPQSFTVLDVHAFGTGWGWTTLLKDLENKKNKRFCIFFRNLVLGNDFHRFLPGKIHPLFHREIRLEHRRELFELRLEEFWWTKQETDIGKNRTNATSDVDEVLNVLRLKWEEHLSVVILSHYHQ